MAESQEQATEQKSGSSQNRGGNGSDARRTALRAAAIAAASGATAIAAKRAFSDRQQTGPSKQENGGSASGGDSLFGGMVGSGLHAAKDSLVPFAEDAARAAGEYLARSGPEVVRETIVPSFIAGFQEAQKSGDE
jgi:hypothetical protein